MRSVGDFPEHPDLSTLAWFALRRDVLCSGAAKCPESRAVSCLGCGATWEPRSRISEPCPQCGNRGWKRLPCDGCRKPLFDAAMCSANGLLLQEASGLLADLKEGFTITWADIPYDTYVAYEILRDLRNDYERELNEKPADQSSVIDRIKSLPRTS